MRIEVLLPLAWGGAAPPDICAVAADAWLAEVLGYDGVVVELRRR